MSVSLILVPAALAVAGVIGGATAAGVASQADRGVVPETRGGATPVRVQTRMKDAALLAAALRDLGAADLDGAEDELTAQVGGLSLRLTRDPDGIWAAHVTAVDGREAQRAEAEELIARMDAAYARQVQQAVAARIRDRADEAGFEFVSEAREQDDSVTMVLAVREER